ncbi:HlyD family type I secretion periplasmic adaptor subunit [Microvirga arabica]|uniref:HlyD family type I secretion periplasmic adaptor subunit n=1 Tax=Microvirga arabica TaxID=1128671 RepID=UPI00193A5BE2|nr:HlyD family type I secretion periplasmic adaptor subunit [Microvirga arabica]MBM1174717.1 HlyD family type I secretion periplasmic adaptor subunit [Microvirga arabica]
MRVLDYSSPAPNHPRLGGPLLLGIVGIGIFFGGFGAWAALAPLSSAASASGQVRVESYRKTVQHLEGGIIREILVKDGDFVAEGDVIARLDHIQAAATANLFQRQRDALKALEARLVAERDGQSTIAFAPELEAQRSDPEVAEILNGQETIFASRRTNIQGQVEVLEQRMSQQRAEIGAYQAQVTSARDQIRLINEELKIVRDLVGRGLEKLPRRLSLERALAQLEGAKGQQLGLIARTEQAIGEAKLQIASLRNAQANEVAAEIRDAQTKLGELEERVRAAADIQSRTTITAPAAGRIVNLRHFTPGGVLKGGEPLLDLVPSADKLVIEARVSPLDIDTVHAGLDAEVKLLAFKQRRLPVLNGKVTLVSADALMDERTGQAFYTAQIELAGDDLIRLRDVQLYPGMPSEVLVLTGQRTPMEYFLDPIRDSFRKAFRED